MNKTARVIAYLFHPTIIPTLGFLLLFHSDFYFSMLGWQAKRLVLLIIFLPPAFFLCYQLPYYQSIQNLSFRLIRKTSEPYHLFLRHFPIILDIYYCLGLKPYLFLNFYS